MEQKVPVRQLFGAVGKVVRVQMGIKLQDQRIDSQLLVSWEYAQVVTSKPDDRVAGPQRGPGGLSGRLPPVGARLRGIEGELADPHLVAIGVGPGRAGLALGIVEHLAQRVGQELSARPGSGAAELVERKDDGLHRWSIGDAD